MAATAQVVALDEVSLCDIVVLKEAKITKDKVVATLLSFCYLVAIADPADCARRALLPSSDGQQSLDFGLEELRLVRRQLFEGSSSIAA